MSNNSKRAYSSQRREAKAAETKRRILDAAHNLFKSEGYECMTIEKLSLEAGVSTPTIYAIFQSKRGILRALIDEALPPAQYEALIEIAKQTSSPTKRLKIAATIARQVFDAERAQLQMFQSFSVLAPEFKEFEYEREMRRYVRQEWAIIKMSQEKSLLPGLTHVQARDILCMYTGRDIYRMLVVERGWSSDEYEIWLAQTLIKALVDPQAL